MNKRLLLIIITSLLLSACGFTLRGSETIALGTTIQEIELVTNNSSNELGQILRRRLLASGVEVIEDSSAYKLTLGDEQSIERIVSVNRNIRAGEYELTLISSFYLENDGESVIPSEIIALDQTYEADPTNAAAKTNETAIVETEIRQAIVEQILRRLQTVR